MASILAASMPLQAYGQSEVLKINELEMNPSGTETGNQWIELYNQGEDLLDIGGWLIKSAKLGKTFLIPDGFVILPKDYVVIPFNGVMFGIENEFMILLTPDSVEVDKTPTLSDTGDDDLTWQRFPNGADTDKERDWDLRNSTIGRTNGFPVARQDFTLSVPVFIDQQGNKLEAFSAGQMAGVKSEIVNRFTDERTFTYIVKITDEDGFTVFMSWVEDLTVLPNRTVKPAIFWFAEERGNFLVESFVWRSLSLPEVLTPSESGLLRVAG